MLGTYLAKTSGSRLLPQSLQEPEESSQRRGTQLHRTRPHWPLADAGENAAETMKEPEGLIPPTRRRRHRLAGAAREPKPR